MSEVLVVYQSKYGTAMRYAIWLGEAFSCEVRDVMAVHTGDLKHCRTVIIVGAVYGRVVGGISFIRNFSEILRNKKVFLLAVGAAPPSDEVITYLRDKNLKSPLRGIPFYYLRGAWNEFEMSIRDRMVVREMYRALKKRHVEAPNPWEKTLLGIYGKEMDWVNRIDLQPVIDDINKRMESGV